MFALACADEVPPPEPDPLVPTESCSELTRQLARIQGREFEICGSTLFRTLTSLANGFVLGWTPFTREYDLWQLRSDGSFGPPLASNDFSTLRYNRRFTGVGSHVLEHDHRSGVSTLWQFDAGARGRADPIPQFLANNNWAPLLGGRQFIALGENHWLEWRPGRAEFGVLEYSSQQPPALIALPGVGTTPAFQRGQQLVYLGPGLMLEWSQRTGEYRIWSYDLSRPVLELFEAEPRAAGQFDGLGEAHELMLLAPNRLGVWDRDAGTVEVLSFDADALAPLSGETLHINQDDRFRSPRPAWEKATSSAVRRLLVIFHQGRSFDAYFGRYCRAPAGSGPSCEQGPDCCEAAPETVAGQSCQPLDASSAYVPDESNSCARAKREAWSEDRLTTSLPGCGDPLDFVCADPDDPGAPVSAYHALAREGALADRYFASIAYEAELNLYYVSGLTAGRVPMALEVQPELLTSLLAAAEVPFALYLPSDREPPDPPYYYDGSWSHFRGLGELTSDIEAERLPPVSIAVTEAGMNEAPGDPRSLANGVEFATRVARAVLDSRRYKDETLVIIAHLSSGGFYDHVTPPPPPPLDVDPDNLAYGSRVPFLALGAMVRKNHVSHVELEHSSLTAFVEWNWLGGVTGQLGGRDGFVSNLGSLLDPNRTATP